jgi:GNAT superfamily N-acetyltransferase
MPDSVRVRPACADDYEHFVRLVPELGVEDPIPDAERWALAFMPDTIILELDGIVSAYARAQTLENVGYVRHLVVAPQARRRGMGRLAMETIATRLREAECREWCLNVMEDNRAAIALYRSFGMEVAYRTIVLRLPWNRLDGLPPPEPATTVAPVEAAEDAALEAALDLPEGLLTSLRPLEDQVLLGVRIRGDFVGVARFDPEYPGCYPFRARSASDARALLRPIGFSS